MFGVPFEAWFWWCGECLELEHDAYAAHGGRGGDINSVISEFFEIHLFDLGLQKRGFVDLRAQANAIAETRNRLINLKAGDT